jgi:HK97 gp10 family phage protein
MAFISHRKEFETAAEAQILKGLEECGIVAESYAKDKCPVDTGNLRNSITHKVVSDEHTAYIGTNTKYASYVELGTGMYYAGGRQTPWVYKGSDGHFYTTEGNKAQPYLKPAVANHSSEYNKILKDALRGE